MEMTSLEVTLVIILTRDDSTDTIYGGDGNDLSSGGGVVVNTVGSRISGYDPLGRD